MSEVAPQVGQGEVAQLEVSKCHLECSIHIQQTQKSDIARRNQIRYCKQTQPQHKNRRCAIDILYIECENSFLMFLYHMGPESLS